MKKYITVLANDLYLKGTLVLNESIKRTHSKYEMAVLIGDEVTDNAKKALNLAGIEIVKLEKTINLPKELIKNNEKEDFAYWTNTFLKLLVFDLIQYEKLIFIDSDIIVLENIDELFEKPHMSAIPPNRYFMKDMNLSSSLLVIEPKENFSDNFYEYIEKLAKIHSHMGDQDVLIEYYKGWVENTDLHIDVSYDMDFGSIPFHFKNYGYGTKNKPIKVVHFPGKKKPWMNRLNHIEHYFKHIIRRNWISLKTFAYYDTVLNYVIKTVLNKVH